MITIPGVDPWMMWVGFIILVLIMLTIDLGVFNRKDHVIGMRESLTWDCCLDYCCHGVQYMVVFPVWHTSWTGILHGLSH